MTLEEIIASGHVLSGTCTSCGRSREIEPATINLPADTEMEMVQARMRCRGCDEMTITLSAVRRRGTLDEVTAHPTVQAVVQAFPGATVRIEGEDGH